MSWTRLSVLLLVEEGGGVGKRRDSCAGKTMSAMRRLFGGGICGPRHCCSLDIELGRLRRRCVCGGRGVGGLERGAGRVGGGVDQGYRTLSVCVCKPGHTLG